MLFFITRNYIEGLRAWRVEPLDFLDPKTTLAPIDTLISRDADPPFLVVPITQLLTKMQQDATLKYFCELIFHFYFTYIPFKNVYFSFRKKVTSSIRGGGKLDHIDEIF